MLKVSYYFHIHFRLLGLTLLGPQQAKLAIYISASNASVQIQSPHSVLPLRSINCHSLISTVTLSKEST
jgi:hypothetical protein